MSLKTILIWILLGLLGVFITTFSLRGIQLGSGSDPTLAYAPKSEKIIRENSQLLLKYNETSGADIAKKIIANTKDILRYAPLNDDALLQLAQLNLLQDDKLDNSSALKPAFNRNARNRNTLRSLLHHHINGENYDKLIELIELLYRLDDKNSESYDVILDKVYVSPGRDILLSYFSKRPTWSDSFLIRKFRAEKTDITKIEPLITAYLLAAEDPARNVALVNAYISRLIKENRYPKAYEVWKSFGFGSESTGPLNFNAEFDSLAATPPFNWKFINWKAGGAEYDESNGNVYIYFNEPVKRLLIQQVVSLERVKTDSLTFSYTGRGRFSPQQGQFEWAFNCSQKVSPFFEFDVDPKTLTGGVFEIDIGAIPENCNFLNIKLFGKPGLYQGRVSMILDNALVNSSSVEF